MTEEKTGCGTCGREFEEPPTPEGVCRRFAEFMADGGTDHEQGGEWIDWVDTEIGREQLLPGFGFVKMVHLDDSQVTVDSYGDKSGEAHVVLEVSGVLLRQDLAVDSYGGVNPKGELRVVSATPKTITVTSYE